MFPQLLLYYKLRAESIGNWETYEIRQLTEVAKWSILKDRHSAVSTQPSAIGLVPMAYRLWYP